MPLPDENKGKSARDLIARFQTNINATSEAPLKPRHSFGSNERFEGDNSNPDISEAKRNPSSRISNARESLEAGLSALSMSRSASGASSSSLSSTTRERASADTASKQAVASKEGSESSEATDDSRLDLTDAPSTPQKSAPASLDKQPNATEGDAQENNNETASEKKEQIETSESTSTLEDVVQSAEVAAFNQAESVPDVPASVAEENESATIMDTSSKPKEQPEQQTQDNNPISTAQDKKLTSKAPVLAKSRNIPKTGSPLPSPNKSVSSDASTKLPPSKSSSLLSKTPQKASTASLLSPSVNKSISAKTPSRPTPAKTPKTRDNTTLSPAPFARRSVISPTPTSSSSSRLTRPTEVDGKKVLPSQVEHASELKKSTPSTRIVGSASASRNTPSSLAGASTSRPTSVISSGSTGSTTKFRRTPLLSSTSRRAASEDSGTPSSSTLAGSKSSSAQRGTSSDDTGKAQAVASPSDSKTALAKSRKGLNVPFASNTPAKSPTTKLSSASNSASPASTPPSGDTLARLMRPTIASQAHARPPARSPVAPSPTASTSAAARRTGDASQFKNGSPAALKKARSYAGTAAAGSRAKVPRESVAQLEMREDNKASVNPVEERLNDDAASEKVPEDEDIPEIPAEDEEIPEERHAIHSQESSAGRSEGDTLAPPLSTTSSSAAGTSELDDVEAEPADSNGEYIPTEKVFTGFGPNRPYGKIGLPTEQATAEEAALRPVDEENNILPPNLRIKQPHELEDLLDGKESGSKQEGFTDKWGSREIASNPLPLRSPGIIPTKSDQGGNDVNRSEKKVPIWMRKGGEA